MTAEEDAYHALCGYTLARRDAAFIQAIHAWCASVWAAFADSRQTVADLLRRHGIV